MQFDRGAWWVITHHEGTRRRRRLGPSNADKRAAEEIAKKLNAAIALGTYNPGGDKHKPFPFDEHVRQWHRRYSVAFKPRYLETSAGLIERHLVPHFGSKDLREIREADLLDYIRSKVDQGQKPATILNALSLVRRVLNLAVREGLLDRNPANGVGRLISRVARREESEVRMVDAWTRDEAATLLALAREHEAAPLPPWNRGATWRGGGTALGGRGLRAGADHDPAREHQGAHGDPEEWARPGRGHVAQPGLRPARPARPAPPGVPGSQVG